MREIINYIKENKIEILPHILSPFILILLIILPIPFSKSWIALLYAPLFFGFFLRALAKTEKDNLQRRQKYFIIFTVPFLLFLVVFGIGLWIYLFLRDFNLI